MEGMEGSGVHRLPADVNSPSPQEALGETRLPYREINAPPAFTLSVFTHCLPLSNNNAS